MKALDRQFTEIINGSKQFVIPVFQRDYSWTTVQCKQLWVDIMRSGGSATGGSHFMGSIVYADTGNAGAVFSRWMVIDGQQRLTTLILLLTALRDHVAETFWTGGDDSPTVANLDAYFLKNMQENGGRLYKLSLRRVDNATLQALIEGNRPSANEASERVMDAYDWFRKALQDCDPDVVYQGIGRLKIVDVTLDRKTDNPQLVFESLNSTGVDLSQSDLIRNYLLMELEESEQTRLYEKYWKRIEDIFRKANRTPDLFFRDYIALKMRTTSQARADQIYDAFKEFRGKTAAEFPLGDLLQDMTRFADYYVSLIGSASGQSKQIFEAIRNVRSLGTTTHALLGMRLFDCYKGEASSLSDEEFVQALRLIESYIVRRGVLGLQSRDYWSIFARIALTIDDNKPLESLKVAFARQQHYQFPHDQEFSQKIQARDLYRDRSLCLHILTRLENDGQKEPSPVRDYSVEHIMPQKIADVLEWQQMLGENWEEIHQKWLHWLGNLTFTAYNSTLSNRPFEEKKTVFEQSAARLNQYVRKQAVWTEVQMQERGEMLAQRALEIWPHHQANEKLVREEAVRELREKAARQNSDSLSMSATVKELLHSVLVQVCELGDIIKVVENKSVCCYAPDFFVEILPMKHHVRLILPLVFDEVDVPQDISAEDTTDWKFVPNRTHGECGMLVDVHQESQVAAAMPIVRQAFSMRDE